MGGTSLFREGWNFAAVKLKNMPVQMSCPAVKGRLSLQMSTDE